MKYTHYAPNAPVLLIDCKVEKVKNAVQQLQAQGQKVALLAPDNFRNIKVDFYFSVGVAHRKEEMGAALYHALRACDKTAATIILATTTSSEGVGAAIMNRLEKASGGKWYTP
ncbi:Threonylcarbamoyl-AMP synthase [compost metagenome]